MNPVNRFMIGQYGWLDIDKQQRDFRSGFYGVEACLFGREEDAEQLRLLADRQGFQLGVHFPLRQGNRKIRDALFLSQHAAARELAFQAVEEELQYLTAIRPEYVLFHYPKPVLLDTGSNWEEWRFADPSEWVWQSDYPREEFKQSTAMLFEWLESKGTAYRFIPVLEFDAVNSYMLEDGFLEDLLQQHDSLRLCLDLGRLHYQASLDRSFDPLAVLRKFAKYAHLIHLSNVQINENGIAHYHHPALPDLQPEDGWAPIEQYFQIVREENSTARILFEHRSDWITEQQLGQCYDWIERLLNNKQTGVSVVEIVCEPGANQADSDFGSSAEGQEG